MKKRIIAVLLCAVAVLSLCGCNPFPWLPSVEKQEVPEEQKKTCTMAELDALMANQPLIVKSTKYLVQDEQYKALYPDMLQAVIYNNTTADIKNAIVAFVAWDENNLPVKIKGSIDFSDGSYVTKVNFKDINLAPGGTYGESSGYEVDEKCNISSFKACVVSFETFGGEKWENPYFDEWSKLYSGVKYDESLTVDVVVEEETFAVSDTPAPQKEEAVSAAELQAQLDKQEVRVISTNYKVQDEELKTLYPDMLQAVMKNDSKSDIKSVVVAFVAWDENNLPVKIKGSIDFSDGSYVKRAEYDEANMIPGGTCGENKGFEIDENCKIKTFKACVVSYTTFDGNEWENPLFGDWCKLYEGVKLAQ